MARRGTCRRRSMRRGASCRANIPQNPSYRKVNPGDSASIVLALTSDILTQAQLYDIAANSVLATEDFAGGGRRAGVGGRKRAARGAGGSRTRCCCRSHGLGLEAVRTSLSRGECEQAERRRWLNGDITYTIAANDQLFGAALYEPRIVAADRGNGARGTPLQGVTRLSGHWAGGGQRAGREHVRRVQRASLR